MALSDEKRLLLQDQIQNLLKAGQNDRDDWIKALARAASNLDGRLELEALMSSLPNVASTVEQLQQLQLQPAPAGFRPLEEQYLCSRVLAARGISTEPEPHAHFTIRSPLMTTPAGLAPPRAAAAADSSSSMFMPRPAKKRAPPPNKTIKPLNTKQPRTGDARSSTGTKLLDISDVAKMRQPEAKSAAAASRPQSAEHVSAAPPPSQNSRHVPPQKLSAASASGRKDHKADAASDRGRRDEMLQPDSRAQTTQQAVHQQAVQQEDSVESGELEAGEIEEGEEASHHANGFDAHPYNHEAYREVQDPHLDQRSGSGHYADPSHNPHPPYHDRPPSRGYPPDDHSYAGPYSNDHHSHPGDHRHHHSPYAHPGEYSQHAHSPSLNPGDHERPADHRHGDRGYRDAQHVKQRAGPPPGWRDLDAA
ncbi:hypothetical protein WJX73_007731 [Symbiochloris irregularis]|uniref:PH domain-containing protein n=1 Tax=Symbiochloris irregularis TaxID=706552 RepID=A0AAW1P0J7_9CHLO